MYAHRGWVDKGTELQALRPLAPLAITDLQHEHMYDTVTELFTDILNHFPAFLTSDDFRALSIFLSTEGARNTVARLRIGDFDTGTMSFAKILLAYGDAAVQDLAENPDDARLTQILFQLLELLKCDGYGGVEDEICSQALEFWTSYTEFVVDSLFDNTEKRPAWVDLARQRIELAIEACWAKIRMPPHEIAVTWDSGARSSLKNFRKDVHDLLLSSYRLLGVDIFEKLAQLALQSHLDRAWLQLEATLFCLNALADSVADDDSIDGSLLRIFGSSLLNDMLDVTEVIPARTRHTAVTMISNYTAFFERHPEHLPAMLSFLFESLRFPALANVAAKAIFSACSSCRGTLTPELGVFLQQLEEISTWDTRETNIKEKLIGAIAAIIEALPSDEEKVAPLAQLILSVERDFEKCIRGMEASNVEEFQESGINALKCLVSMGKALQTPDEAVINLEVDVPSSSFWAEGQGASLQDRVVRILQIVTGLLKSNSDMVETSCQILRIGYKERTPGLFVFPLKITVDYVLATTLDTARLDFVLDTAGIALLSRAGSTDSVMVNASSSIMNYLLRLTTSLGCK